MILTDTHTHLYYERDAEKLNELMERCLKNSVSRLFLPNVNLSTIPLVYNLSQQYQQNCFPMLGLHPGDVKAVADNEVGNYKAELAGIRKAMDEHKFYAVGEIGIDLYWDKTFIKEQELAFREQIYWALEYNYTVVIHCRNAFDEIFSILKSYDKLPKGIFHCFSGDFIQAEKILSLGNFKLGIGGVVTFKNSGLDKVVEQLKLTDLVLETDAPYLAPMPYRGKRNESSYLPLIAQKIAEIKNITIEEVAEVTSQNALEIFEN